MWWGCYLQEGWAGEGRLLQPLEVRYKVVGYADDLKPAVTSMDEFELIDKGSSLFERSSGCKIHRDPSSGKCKFLPLGRWRGTLKQDDIPFPYMVLSDHLDMVGVELKATYTQTRKANGDILQTRIKNTIGPWQAGKFMPVSQRPWSINSYALSKVWYKCNSVDLRVADINFITSKVKAWLMADQLEKPEEMVLYRPSSYGGLGLHHVKLKAEAMLIRSFLETAANPKYIHNLYHTSLYRYYVLQHTDMQDPGLPPYYSLEFFNTIRATHENTSLNVETMSSSQWYTMLLQNNITMEEVTPDSARHFRAARAERAYPDNDWDSAWRMARLRGLGSELTSFLWKLLHGLLPTQDRVSRILRDKTPLCKLCPDAVMEDLQHAFFRCSYNNNCGELLSNFLSSYIPGISTNQILHLNMDLEPSEELSVAWMTGNFLYNIWNARLDKKQVRQYTIRADLEARASILSETRFSDETVLIREMIHHCFDSL